MKFTINGFCADPADAQECTAPGKPIGKCTAPKKSLVRVQFPGNGMALTYYNDAFDPQVGDRVYVDGQMEGILGRVTDVSYNFKIKLSDYKKIIALVDTDVHGAFHMAGSHFVTFDPAALPLTQVLTWFRAPAAEEDEIVSGTDDSSFRLSDLSGMNISNAVAQRGNDYYMESKVRYICLNGSQGHAIVEGSKNYLVEFEYRNGEICALICDCPCCFTCKHEFAAMLQLRETLELIETHYKDSLNRTGYFAAIAKGTLFSFAIDGKETGSFTL